MVGRCRLAVLKPVLKAPMVSAHEATIQYDGTFPNFAFNFNLRRYMMVMMWVVRLLLLLLLPLLLLLGGGEAGVWWGVCGGQRGSEGG